MRKKKHLVLCFISFPKQILICVYFFLIVTVGAIKLFKTIFKSLFFYFKVFFKLKYQKKKTHKHIE